jgi:hypothetical protein
LLEEIADKRGVVAGKRGQHVGKVQQRRFFRELVLPRDSLVCLFLLNFFLKEKHTNTPKTNTIYSPNLDDGGEKAPCVALLLGGSQIVGHPGRPARVTLAV